MGFIDLIFFAGLAIFLGYRLWNLLGTHDADRPLKKQTKDDSLSVTRTRPPSSSQRAAPQDTSSEDEKKEAHFLTGARGAFYKIVEAYANEDLQTLRHLVKGPLLDTFEDAITKRKKAKKTLEVDIGSTPTAQILEKWEERGDAYITVRFVSQQSLLTKNASGKILEGDPDRYSEVTDIWTFSRPLRSLKPNWFLIATQIPEGKGSPPVSNS